MRLFGFHSRPRHVSALLVVFGAAAGCAAASDKDAGLLGTSGLGDGGRQVIVLDGSTNDSGAGDAGRRLNPLCGQVGLCGSGNAPDDPLACAEHQQGNLDAGAPFAPDSGRVRTLSDAGQDASGDATASVDAASDSAADASFRDATVASGNADRDGAIDASRAPPAAEAGPVAACQVHADDNGNPVHQCGPAGSGDVTTPCASSNDCKPGLACVEVEGKGQCLPYCCDSRTLCNAGTFCANRPLFEQQPTALQVPVCAVAEGCQLDEPYPCEGPTCRCTKGNACAIVLGNGTTGCVPPGTGHAGDPCAPSSSATALPCAAGYFCSAAANTCVKICNTSAGDATCLPGKCQAEAGFPDNFGLCIGPSPLTR